MKKVININFQGRVIPIEETAYEMLQNYISSLRNYFANEEGRDEIINDIENRIGELFDERLKKGASCIMDSDVNNIMNSMGRPEDFDQQDEPQPQAEDKRYESGTNAGSTQPGNINEPAGKKRLYRDEQDKILGGVASGLAHYLNIDPAVIRILFAVLAIFGGSGFLVYIILWIVLPSRSLITNIRKRLYRDTEDRVISGVCGGLAKYFDINPAMPRIIFAAPFIFGIITSVGRSFFNDGSVAIGGFGGGTFILVYIILWIVLPEAFTASEKLEMKGEKVDLNSIRDTVVSDLHGIKGRAEKFGNEMKESAQRFGSEFAQRGVEFGGEFGNRGAQFGNEFGQAARRSSRGLGNAIAILVKAFMLFIGGCIALGLFAGLIALLGSGVGVLPLRDFFLQGEWQSIFAWGTILLFVGVPVVAFLVWFIRRLMRVTTHNKYIGYAFSALWFVGLFCLIAFIGTVSKDFSGQVGKREDINIVQPTNGKLVVAIERSNISYSDGWIEWDGVLSVDRDSLFLNTARVNVIKSKDNLFHLHLVKISKGRDRNQAQTLAEKISFPIVQRDSALYLPETFAVSKNEKWRNQKVLVVIEVPEGKQVYIDERVSDYDYFNVEFGRRRNWRMDWDRSWEDGEWWRSNEDLIMTNDGLKNVDDLNRKEENKNDSEEFQQPASPTKPSTPATPAPDSSKKDTVYQYRAQLNIKAPNWNDKQELSAEDEVAKTPKTSMNNPLGAVLRLR
jgi:phage shock protein PspC (stress-responsive transcriptional regulator)/heme/copper-type cytochrome/quinol oxidase subunit 2